MSFSIVQKPSPNFWQGRNGEQVKAICFHGTGSPQNPLQPGLDDIDGVFANPNYQASTHFAIGRDGSIHQYVDVHNAAWGNGVINNPNLTIPWIKECVEKGINPNNRTISIETKNDGSNSLPLTDIQYQALVWLVRGLLAQFPNIPIDKTGFIGHRDIDSVNRARCPGPNFPMDKLIQEFTMYHCVETGFDVVGDFFKYFNVHGGVEIFGFPVTAEVKASDYGLTYQGSVQWFQRSRFEWHDKEQMVMLGLIGSELLAKG